MINATVVNKECRFATYVSPPEQGAPDMLVVKEKVYYSDGTTKPVVNFIKDFEREFYVTRKGNQNHKQKKEWELKSNLLAGKSKQYDLVHNAAKLLGEPWFKGNLRKLASSPYLYGTDISSTAIVKKLYKDKYPDVQSKYTVAVFDTETDVINGTEEIIMASFTFGNIVHTAVVAGFVKGIANVQERVDDKMKQYLGEYVVKRKLECTLVIVKNAIEAVISCINKAHEHKPDFLAIWNIDFDINKVLDACNRYRVDPKDIFSDPSVPAAYRYFDYTQGKKQKITSSGLMTPIKPAAQWHVVTTPASFYLIDAMCVYKQVRAGAPEEQSYSLDAILDKNLGIRKLKFEEANHVIKLKWHQLMQTKYPIEYIIYNRFDCISMELLDETTNDLSLSVPLFSGFSDFANFNSQPKRMIDKLHYYVQDKDRVMASTGGDMKEDLDEETLSLSGWISVLPAHLVADNGLAILEENPGVASAVRTHVADLDVRSSYPSGECTLNISKETTVKEFISIENIEETVMRMQGINLSGGQTNAAEFCQTVLKAPLHFELLKLFEQASL